MTEKPRPEDYKLLIEREWADLHHSRVQEWTALGVVMGTHLGLIQLVKFAIDAGVPVQTSTLIGGASVIGAVFALLGALMTCRHRQLMKIKLGWIYEAEHNLGLIKTEANSGGVIPERAKMSVPVEWRGLALPRLLSTGGLMLCFYVLLLAIDTLVLVKFA
jgi:hypothetical protein